MLYIIFFDILVGLGQKGYSKRIKVTIHNGFIFPCTMYHDVVCKFLVRTQMNDTHYPFCICVRTTRIVF
jgi:hypothetical protein